MRRLIRPAGSHRRRLASTLVPVLALVGAVVLVAGFTTKKSASAYTVAWVGPLTGPFAPSSQSLINTMNQYFAQVNAKGGINGHPIKLVTKDDGGDPTATLQDVRDLSGQGVKIFYIQTTSGEIALQPLMNGSIITFNGLPPAFLDDPKQYPFNFNFFPPNQYAIQKDAQYLKKLGATKVALVTNTTTQFQEYIDWSHKIFPAQGINVVLEQRYDPTTTDYSSIITKVQQSGAQAVLDFSFGGEATNFYNAAAAANLQIPVLGGYGNAAADLSTVPKSYLEKWATYITQTPNLLDPKTNQPQDKHYSSITKQIFYHKYGLKTNVGGSTAWDEPAAIVWAIKKAGSDDPAKMRAALESTARASAGVAFTPGGIVYHFSNTQHCGYPPSALALARLYGVPQWPGYYYAAS